MIVQQDPDTILTLINELVDIDIKQTESFSFNGLETYAKVIKCYDFNKINIIFKFNNIFIRYNCKINGIKDNQTKEIASKNQKKIETLLLNKVVYIKFRKFDNFGRILINIIQNGKDISINFK